MNPFIVFADGVYRHEIWGPFPDIESAKAFTERKSEDEKWCDGYHRLVVSRLAGDDDIAIICAYVKVKTIHNDQPIPYPIRWHWEWLEGDGLKTGLRYAKACK